MLTMIYRANLLLCIYLSLQLSVGEAANTDLLSTPPFHHIDLSPNGSHLATYSDSGPDERKVLFVETATGKTSRFSIGDGKGGQAEIASIDWVGNDHLAVTTKLEDGIVRLYTVSASDRDEQRRTKENNTIFIGAIKESSRFIVAEQSMKKDSYIHRVLEYDAANSNAPIERYRIQSKTFECRMDTKGRLRLLKRDDGHGNNTAWYAIDPESGSERKLNTLQEWTKVQGIIGTTNQAIIAGHIDSPLPSIYVYDFQSDKIVQILADHPIISVEQHAHTVFDQTSGNVVGLHLDLYERTSHWIDPEFAALQTQVDAELKGTYNRILDWSDDREHLIVERFIPTLPTQYLYLNVSQNNYSPMLMNGPALKPQDIGRTQLIKMENRSGGNLTAVLTLPPGKPSGQMPLLVWLGDELWGNLQRPEWHPEANFFASDGFAVMRINYTGSLGLLGNLKANKTNKEGILALFRDIEDATKTLVDAGVINPRKVCIGGEGTAGWAAAYAPIASPGMYQGIISINGLYDLVEYREASKGDNQMNGGLNIDFASVHSQLTEADLHSLSVPQNLESYADTVFLTTGKWSTQEYKNHINSFAKALKREKVSVKIYTDDWWGPQLNGFKRVEAFKRAASMLRSAVK